MGRRIARRTVGIAVMNSDSAGWARVRRAFWFRGMGSVAVAEEAVMEVGVAEPLAN